MIHDVFIEFDYAAKAVHIFRNQELRKEIATIVPGQKLLVQFQGVMGLSDYEVSRTMELRQRHEQAIRQFYADVLRRRRLVV